jgi:hypothetical protein
MEREVTWLAHFLSGIRAFARGGPAEAAAHLSIGRSTVYELMRGFFA